MLESSKSMSIESTSLSESSSSGLKSEPEPLGSLTFTQDGETGGCLQLRTSARVSKKLRLDLTSSFEEKKGKHSFQSKSLSKYYKYLDGNSFKTILFSIYVNPF